MSPSTQATPSAPETPAKKRRSYFSRDTWIVLSVSALLLAAGLGLYLFPADPEPVARHIALGKAFLDAGEYASARAEYRQALVLDPGNAAASQGLRKARVFERPDGALDRSAVQQRIQQLLDADPDDAHAHLFLGELHNARGDRNAAATSYQRAIDLDADVAQAYFRLGVLHYQAGRLDEALRMTEQAAARSITPKYWNRLAWYHTVKKDYPKAVETYRRALSTDSNFLLSYIELAKVYWLGDLQQARALQETAVALLQDPEVTALARNREPWSFATAKPRVAELDQLPEKQCYAYYNLSITLHLLDEQSRAQANVARARALAVPRAAIVLAAIDFDLTRLGREVPAMQVRLQLYRQRFGMRETGSQGQASISAALSPGGNQ